MEINLNNYQAFLLDLSEGKLDAKEKHTLQIFLLSNGLEAEAQFHGLPQLIPDAFGCPDVSGLLKDLPDATDERLLRYLEGLDDPLALKMTEKQLTEDAAFRARFELFRNTLLSGDSEKFPDKDLISIDRPSAIEERVLSYGEGLMSGGERSVFEQELQVNKTLTVLWNEFSNCRFEPEPGIVFPHKQDLYRQTKEIGLFGITALRRVTAGLAAILLIAVFLLPDVVDEHQISENTISIPEISEQENFPLQVKKVKEPAPGSGHEQVVVRKRQPGKKKENADVPEEKAEFFSAQDDAQFATATSGSDEAALQVESVENVVALAEKNNESVVLTNAGAILVGAQIKRVEELSLLEVVEENEVAQLARRSGFWQKAAALASQIKKFGVKGFETERSHNTVKFSFNGVSVEKKFADL